MMRRKCSKHLKVPTGVSHAPCGLFQVGLGKDTKATFTLGFTKSNELFVGRLASALTLLLAHMPSSILSTPNIAQHCSCQTVWSPSVT